MRIFNFDGPRMPYQFQELIILSHKLANSSEKIANHKSNFTGSFQIQKRRTHWFQTRLALYMSKRKKKPITQSVKWIFSVLDLNTHKENQKTHINRKKSVALIWNGWRFSTHTKKNRRMWPQMSALSRPNIITALCVSSKSCLITLRVGSNKSNDNNNNNRTA